MTELDNSPVETELGSPSAPIDNTTNDVNPDAGILQFAQEQLNEELGLPLDGVVDSEVKQKVSEESKEEETIPEESSDDSKELEADTDTKEESDVTPEEVEEPSNLELVDTDSLDEFLFPTPEGNKTWAQIQSELGQVKAASKKSREATAQLKELDDKKAELDKQEAWLKERLTASTQVDELAQIANQAQAVNKQLEKARAEEDYFQISKLKDNLDLLTKKYNDTQTQVQKVQEEAQNRHLQSQYKILEDKGYNNLMKEGATRTKFIDYAKANLSDQAAQAVSYDASLSIALEKARLWDESQTKAKGSKKLRGSGKTLRSGADTTIKEIKKPIKTQEDAEAALLDFAKTQLGS